MDNYNGFIQENNEHPDVWQAFLKQTSSARPNQLPAQNPTTRSTLKIQNWQRYTYSWFLISNLNVLKKWDCSFCLSRDDDISADRIDSSLISPGLHLANTPNPHNYDMNKHPIDA